jgi:hypothetical protein
VGYQRKEPIILSPLRLLSWLLALFVIGVPAAAVAVFVLAVTGSPGSCEDEARPISVAPELATAFQLEWDRFNDTLDAGQESTVVLSESEVTSRARVWVDEHDVPVSNLLICFSVDSGTASGTVDVPFFPGDVDVLIWGTVDLRGEHPDIEIVELDVGNMPGPLTGLVEGFIEALINDQEEELELALEHDYGITFRDGDVSVGGQP